MLDIDPPGCRSSVRRSTAPNARTPGADRRVEPQGPAAGLVPKPTAQFSSAMPSAVFGSCALQQIWADFLTACFQDTAPRALWPKEIAPTGLRVGASSSRVSPSVSIVGYIRGDPPLRWQVHQRNTCEPITAAKITRPVATDICVYLISDSANLASTSPPSIPGAVRFCVHGRASHQNVARRL